MICATSNDLLCLLNSMCYDVVTCVTCRDHCMLILECVCVNSDINYHWETVADASHICHTCEEGYCCCSRRY